MSAVIDKLSAALADRYRIERQLGAGGMATVYLAQDLKHDRQVAIKVLKPELAAVLGAERFVVEIKTTAALQHPHILPLFDSGRAGGQAGGEFLYYVMPYIEGETLRDKLNRETQLGIAEAVKIATEVADALDYAHRHGVIHRDIKPENILLHDGRPMVADFGIALALSAAAGGRMTETGLSLGTPHYMSPEQATAEKEITGRSDIYSLASVLYEMLAGQPPHLGGSAQQIIMKIIAEPAEAVTKFRKSVPANVAAAVGKALEKLPADRFESARAFADALANPGFTVSRPAGQGGGVAVDARWRRRFVAMTVLAAALGLLAVASLLRRAASPAPSLGLVRFRLSGNDSLKINTQATTPFAVSPDGRTIVFGAEVPGSRYQLWARSLDAPMARRLENTEGGMQPALSPDGEWIAFVTDNRQIRKVRLAGGPATEVGTLNTESAALAWMSDDTLVAEDLGGKGIHRVSARGGTPVEAIPLDTAANEIRQRRPFVLRRDRMLLYASRTADDDRETLVMVSLTTGRRVRLVEGVQVLGMVDGHLVYTRADGNLMAVAVDVAAMRVTGTPMELGDRVVSFSFGTKVAL